MSDVNDANRYLMASHLKFAEVAEKLVELEEPMLVMSVEDHNRIVAELEAKYKELSDYNDACRKVRYRQEAELAELRAEVARQTKVIEQQEGKG